MLKVEVKSINGAPGFVPGAPLVQNDRRRRAEVIIQLLIC